MTQSLEGIDIYHCQFFGLDSRKKLKFIKGIFYDRTPESWKTMKETKDVIRYCMWIIEQKDIPRITKYCAVVYINRVNQRLLVIEKKLRNALRDEQLKAESKLKKDINSPGTTYV